MINYEAIAAKTFSLAVTVTDPVTSDTKTLTVVVTNVNEAPTVSQSSYTLSAKEGPVSCHYLVYSTVVS